ncbi:MAG: hypothetical protein M3O02_05650 [Acidobacteriota bacterium]|nr:hypothetical protein [Acidobacteriota bacterium]
MRQSNFALRLQDSLLKEARTLSKKEGVALNQFINVAVAQKISALRTAEYFEQRAARANPAQALEILRRPGRGEEPGPDDRLDSDFPPAKDT